MSFVKSVLIFICFGFITPDDSAPEVEDPLDAIRRQLKDTARTVEERVGIALEAAARLDKRAESSETPAGRTKLSIAAITLLDDFNASNPRHSLEVAVAIQAAVYLWADSRRAIDDARLTPSPTDEPIKARARSGLDASIARFGRIEPALSGVDPLVAQNARFRLAQARVDRAGLEPPGSPLATASLKAGWDALEPLPSETAIIGYARLLRADILVKQGEFDAAETELTAASKVKFPPPTEAFLDVRVAQLCGERRYSQAINLVDGSKLDPITTSVLGLKIRLAQRAGISAGGERRDADEDAFKRAQVLRNSPRVDARMALIDLARVIDKPSPHASVEAFDTLADGALALGDAVRASVLLEKAADNAASAKQPNEAARLRLRAGAVLFQDGKYADADTIFTRMWNDDQTGKVRPKAGMLRALARGRAVAEKVPVATTAAYFEALQALVTEYPTDPSTGEARWLLGQAEADRGRFDIAVSHWNAIAEGQPRWLASRLAIAQNNERTLDELSIANDLNAIKKEYLSASAFLNQSLAVVEGIDNAIDLDLARIRLLLRPEIDKAELALALCENLDHRAANDTRHGTIQALKIVALAEAGHYPESEREVRVGSAKLSGDDLKLATKLLDHASVATANAANRSRFGRILLRLLAEIPSKHRETFSESLNSELNLRLVRGQIATGATESAKRTLAGPNAPDTLLLDANGLRDLADAYLRLEAYGMAIDAERFRSRSLKAGTPAWFESRYRLALSLYRTRKSVDARRLIDATEILHPELGGASLKEKFTRLRQRMEP